MFDDIHIYAAPEKEPLDLDEVKHALRWDDLPDAEAQARVDADLLLKIQAVRERCESFIRQSLITQTIDVWYSQQDGLGYFDIPRGPVQQVLSVTLFDVYDEESIVDQEEYSLTGGSVVFRGLVPFYRPRLGVRVRAVVGYGDDPEDVPAILREGMKELIVYAYENPNGAGATARYEVEARLNGDLPQQIAAKWRTKRRIVT